METTTSPRTLKARAPASPSHRHVVSPTKPTLHLSPRKFHQLQQQQRQAVLRGMLPLSPLSPRMAPSSDDSDQPQQHPPTFPSMNDSVLWNPAWLPFPIDSVAVTATRSASIAKPTSISYGTTTLDAWLQSYDVELLQYESLERFVQVKLPEALAFCEKMERQIAEANAKEAEARREALAQRPADPALARRLARSMPTSSAMTRFPVRFRVAVFANLMERTILAMTESAALAHLRPWLLQARQEMFRAVFADYDEYATKRARRRRKAVDGSGDSNRSEDAEDDDDDSELDDDSSSDDSSSELSSKANDPEPVVVVKDRYGPDKPRSLAFFLSRVPFVLKLQDDSQRRSARFQRHQVVLRRIVQSLYRSLGTVFHAWKMHVQQKREERLNDKGAQLTAMVVMQRGLVRTIFVEWSKCALKSKLANAQAREAQMKKTHDDRMSELYKELFLLKEQNTKLQEELDAMRTRRDGNDSSDDDESHDRDNEEP